MATAARALGPAGGGPSAVPPPADTPATRGPAGSPGDAPTPPLPRPLPGEVGGPSGPEPTRYGDWERKGRVSDF